MSLPFSPATNTWFEAAFPAPTPAQAGGWPAIVSGDHTLIHAPTGSGKTLAAFLAAIDRLFTTPGEGTRVLYVSPLKALAHDVERNLRAPLRAGEDLEPHIRETLRIKPERHHLVQGSIEGSGGLVALSQTGG